MRGMHGYVWPFGAAFLKLVALEKITSGLIMPSRRDILTSSR